MGNASSVGNNTWTLGWIDTTTANWANGPVTVWAVASSHDGTISPAVPITLYPDQAPVIDSLMASTETWTGPTELSLTPEGVSSTDGNISEVEYFWTAGANASYSSSDQVLGAVANSGDGWALNINPSVLDTTGPVTVFAVAFDDLGMPSARGGNGRPLTVGQFSASNGTNAYVAGRESRSAGRRVACSIRTAICLAIQDRLLSGFIPAPAHRVLLQVPSHRIPASPGACRLRARTQAAGRDWKRCMSTHRIVWGTAAVSFQSRFTRTICRQSTA